jgi:carbon-monoxide dehydrogenase large subunit
MVAADLGIDPVELRLKNLIQPSAMPYTVGHTRPESTPIVYDSGDYPAVLKKALEVLDYEKIKHLRGRQIEGKYHGVGIACFVKSTGGGQSFEGARVVVTGREAVAVYLGIATMGQGHETTMAQICAQGLGVPIEYVAVYHGSTDLMPYGGGTHASRGTIMAGNAVFKTAQNLKQKILRIGAAYLDIDAEELEFSQGQVHRKATEADGPLLHLGQVLQLANPASMYNQGEIGLEATDYFRATEDCYPCGAHGVHLTVDPETGEIEILKYAVAEDVGHVINPLLLKGQIVGAAAQGIGATILEELVYDENGQLLSGTLIDYLLPTSLDIPVIESAVVDLAPSPRNPLGVKGAGEIGIVATGAALSNAVSNALSSLGVQVRDLPLSPDRLRNLIKQGRPTG